ncbi:hypothetical protein GEMRC1_006083 [Eukaryota sp. GEM-RC1]
MFSLLFLLVFLVVLTYSYDMKFNVSQEFLDSLSDALSSSSVTLLSRSKTYDYLFGSVEVELDEGSLKIDQYSIDVDSNSLLVSSRYSSLTLWGRFSIKFSSFSQSFTGNILVSNVSANIRLSSPNVDYFTVSLASLVIEDLSFDVSKHPITNFTLNLFKTAILQFIEFDLYTFVETVLSNVHLHQPLNILHTPFLSRSLVLSSNSLSFALDLFNSSSALDLGCQRSYGSSLCLSFSEQLLNDIIGHNLNDYQSKSFHVPPAFVEQFSPLFTYRLTQLPHVTVRNDFFTINAGLSLSIGWEHANRSVDTIETFDVILELSSTILVRNGLLTPYISNMYISTSPTLSPSLHSLLRLVCGEIFIHTFSSASFNVIINSFCPQCPSLIPTNVHLFDGYVDIELELASASKHDKNTTFIF